MAIITDQLTDIELQLKSKLKSKLVIPNSIFRSTECDELRKIFSHVRAERNNDSADVNVSAYHELIKVAADCTNTDKTRIT